MNIYDFDHTIYQGDSSVDFTVFYFKRHWYLIIFLPIMAIAYIGIKLHLWSSTFGKECFFLFLKCKPVSNEEVRLFWEKFSSKIHPWYIEHQKSSDIIISASPEFLLNALISEQWKQRLIATKVSPFTGKISGKNCKGIEKVKLLKTIFSISEIDEFYSDSYSDTPLAKLAKKPFIVKHCKGTKIEIKQWCK